jgi:predicted dithiol-disulfide oxidoreductase (DUF899 family)
MHTTSTASFLVVSKDEWSAVRRARFAREWEWNRLRDELDRRRGEQPWAFDGNSQRAPLVNVPGWCRGEG